MATSNCVAEVTTFVTKAIKARDTTEQAPSKWAAAAGFTGSAASPLRQHIARTSDNGCGRSGRYPQVDAAGMLELIELGHQFKAAEDAKKASIAKRIGTKVRPAAVQGARAAKRKAQQETTAPAPKRKKATATR